jgi:hypothetical protein
MIPQLYMYSGIREHYLARHDFYVEEVKRRVLGQFGDISEEAERFAETEYERLGSMPGSEDSDMGDIAQTAEERAQEFYALLSDLRQQMMLGAVAGLYHQWDKDLRDFLEIELRHSVENPEKLAWNQKGGITFDVLNAFGWNCAAEPFFSKIEAARLIVNVHKHGKGGSLEKLAKEYPEYLKDPFPTMKIVDDYVDHEWVTVSDAQFDEIAAALRAFWERFPERLFYSDRKTSAA